MVLEDISFANKVVEFFYVDDGAGRTYTCNGVTINCPQGSLNVGLK